METLKNMTRLHYFTEILCSQIVNFPALELLTVTPFTFLILPYQGEEDVYCEAKRHNGDAPDGKQIKLVRFACCEKSRGQCYTLQESDTYLFNDPLCTVLVYTFF